MKLLLVSIFVFLTACSVYQSSGKKIPVEGNKSTQEKEEIALLVMESVWNGSLKEEIRAALPSITLQELDTNLILNRATTTFTPNTGEDKKVMEVVRISCEFKSSERDVNVRVVEMCAKKIQSELSKHI